MAKSSNDLTNYKKYLNNIKQRGYENLPIPKRQETVDELIAEGNRLLEEDAKHQSSQKTSKITKPTTSSGNPYFQARQKILSDMDPGKRKIIEQMETEGNTDSRQYQEFVEQIHKLGDKLSQ
jgi:hypothetical protein